MSGSSVHSIPNSVAAALPDPASHSYLGPGNSTIDNCHILNAGDEYEILLYPVPDVVLFPGQTIPLRIQNRAFIHKFLTMRSSPSDSLSIVQLVGHIGIVNITQNVGARSISLAKVGTTMEVRSTYRQSFNDVELVVSGKGRYRFFIMEVRSESGVPIAKVKILSDNLPQFATSFHKANPFPPWVYDQYSPRRLARIAYSLFESTMLWEGKDNAIQRWGLLRSLDPDSSVWAMGNTKFAEYEAENDPVGFSFFLCANMPVESSAVQMMLEAECVVQRLRLSISLLRTGLHKRIACARCGSVIATKQDLFNVTGAEGLAAVYVNRYGSVHQTLTVRKLQDNVVRYQGRPCLQDTWFPGYAWTIMNCVRCFSHLGWKYTWVGIENEDGGNSSIDSDEDDENDDYVTIDGDDDDENDDYVTIDGDDEDEEVDGTHISSEHSGTSIVVGGEEDDGDREEDTMDDTAPTQSFSADASQDLSDNLPSLIPLPISSIDVVQSDEETVDDQANQIILSEFWGLTRASIREV